MHTPIPNRFVTMVTCNGAKERKRTHLGPSRAAKATVRMNPILAKVAVAGLLVTMSAVCASAPPTCSATAALDKLDGIQASYTQCMQKSLATSAWRDCTGAESAYQNKRLNAAYKALIAKLDPGHQTKLRSDERTWIRYRDALCTTNPYGLEQPESANLGCTMQENAKRASYLESLVSLAELQS